ncbi:MAG: hypothetical protein PHU23_03380 [Dehalococcoidales bacterium]|nr:hypothetical protein [Dehalococcoidales bacterium]
MRYKRIKIAISAALAAVLLAIFSFPAQAGGLTVSGGKIETGVIPGSPGVHNMTVRNTGETPLDIAVEAKGYGTSSGSSFTVLEPGEDTSPYTARDYLEISPDAFQLAPGESRQITVTVKAPADMGDGGRYAIVFIHTLPGGSGAVATVSAVAARVLLTNNGSALIHDSRIDTLEIGAEKGLTAKFEVLNQGNHHYKPDFRAVLKKGDSLPAEASSRDAWPLIPGYARSFNLIFDSAGPLEPGEYTVEIEVRDESGAATARHTAPYTLNEPYTPEPTAAASPAPVNSSSPSAAAPAQAQAPAQPVPANNGMLFGIIGGLTALVIILGLALIINRRKK